MKPLKRLISFAAARAFLHRAAAASLAVGLIIPGAYAHTADDPFVTDLVAGGGNPASAIDVGDVLVWNDAEQLFVRYLVTAQDWCLTETHSHVASSADAIPQTKKGNPIPGKFAFAATLECVTSYTLVVPLTWEPGVQLFIATHASVKNPTVVYIDGPWEETAWGAGFDFPGRNWAMYFTYTVQEEPTASLGDFVWEDLNANGIQDPGEPGIPGVEVQLIDDNGVVVDTTTTGANGSYEFNNLVSGMGYMISFINPDPDGPDAYHFSPRQVGADPALDSDGPMSDSVTLGAGEFNDTLDAGLFRRGSIHVYGFLDTDGDGILDNDEGPFPDPGKTFELLDENGNVIATATTFNGMVGFEQLPPGTYTVRENPIPDGFVLTTLPNERTFTLISGEELVYEDGAAMLPAGDRRFETNVGDELRWGNTGIE
jgi:hypothetical protein